MTTIVERLRNLGTYYETEGYVGTGPELRRLADAFAEKESDLQRVLAENHKLKQEAVATAASSPALERCQRDRDAYGAQRNMFRAEARKVPALKKALLEAEADAKAYEAARDYLLAQFVVFNRP